MQYKNFLWIASLVLMSITGLGAKSVEDVLSQARSYLGDESTLNNVQTMQFEARIVDKDGKDIEKMIMLLKKPNQYRELRESEKFKVITATNGYEGFRLLTNLEENKSRLIVLKVDAVKNLRILAAENLYFLKAYERLGAEVSYEGVVDAWGEKADKLVFQYRNGRRYERFFDPTTGNLLATLVDDGTRLVEKESRTISGIRFPQQLEAYDKDGNLAYRMHFDAIKLNEPVEDKLFEFPKLIGK